jgi:hypothetical protein
MSENEVVKDEITYYVLVKKERRYFGPQNMGAGATIVQWIFPVPRSRDCGYRLGYETRNDR